MAANGAAASAVAQRVMIIADMGNKCDVASTTATSLTLPNPRTGRPQAYLLYRGALLEVNRFRHKHAAWFVGQRILSNGSIYLATPLDPLFFALPMLQRCRAQSGNATGPGVFTPLDSVLDAAPEGAEGAAWLRPLLAPHLGCICDVKQAGDDAYYRLNDHRVVAWLCCKARQAAAAFRSSGGPPLASLDDASLLAYAAGFVAEYCPEAWHQRLADALGTQLTGVHTQGGAANGASAGPRQPNRFEAEFDEPADKKPKLDPKEAAKKKAEASRAEAKVAAMAKQAAGTKKIASFFAKK